MWRIKKNILHKKIVNTSGFIDREVERGDFYVLKDTEMPAVLLKIGYLTNPEDEQRMLSEDFQKHIATAIFEGIKEYFKIGQE
jgi:N-acetylmuramoyl-L-alanine amidase